MSGRSRWRALRWPLLLLMLGVAALGVLRLPSCGEAERAADAPGPRRLAESRAGADAERLLLGPAARRAESSDPGGASLRCRPYASRACVAGDVYWLDGCGAPHDKQDECGDALCRDGACAAQDPERCAELTLHGQCDGDVARGCVGGVPYESDCAASGERCVVTDEGAQCRALRGPACVDPDVGRLPRCEGQRLLRCVDGEVVALDCGQRDALCGELAPGAGPGCFRVERRPRPPDPLDPCEPCGCLDEGLAGEELCDGRDNDEDGVFDEQAACEPIPIVAFIVGDGALGGSYSAEDLAREIERINRVLAPQGDELGIGVELADVVRLDRPDWLELDDDEYQALLHAPELRVPRDEFYVPVVFTDALSSGETPKAGVSTLPNGRCGGRRVDNAATRTIGAVAVAKGRAPTTVAHEIGHFLGLCHTHFAHGEQVQRVVQWQNAEGDLVERQCHPPCAALGDGICDTPPDPGPESCGYDPACDVRCQGAEEPDPFNVMSYYTACRHALSDLQRLELRRNLYLRRAWYACRDGRCACDPLAPSCPEEMSCRPVAGAAAAGWACGLDGPREPAADCGDHALCGRGAICLAAGNGVARCARLCTEDAPGCQCHPAPTLGVAFCREDVAGG